MPDQARKPDLTDKAGLVARIVEAIFGRGRMDPWRALVLVSLAGTAAYVGGRYVTPTAPSGCPLEGRILALESRAVDPETIADLVHSVPGLSATLNRLDCMVAGGTPSDCLRAFPPPPPLKGSP